MPNASNEEAKSAGTDLSGRQVGDYQLLRRLGRGAMAEVYLAEQKSLNRQVAIKVLKKELASDDTYVQRFQREARAVAALVHANIVQIHEVGCIDGVYFIAQEYVEGLNLKQWLSRHGPLDLRLGLIIMRQVAAALAKAADQRIIHRDIKPENIMLTSSGEVKVADFGLARMSRVGDRTDLTQVGMTLGTPLYMSPEQVEGKPLDPRSDIYSFGVTCYHVLSGSPPFVGDTALNLALQHLKKRAEPLENLRPDLPPALARMVHRMLAKEPADRYQSARELLKELHRLQVEHLDDDWPEDLPGLETAGVEFGDTSLSETTQQLTALMKTARSRKPGWPLWLLWTAGLGVMFLVGGAAAHLTTSETPLLVEEESTSVPRLENVNSQFWYAGREDTEEAWLSVGRYFPDDTYWVQKSRQQLARDYLMHYRYDKAKEIFDEFANLGGPDESLTAFGLAGQFSLFVQEENYREAARKLDLLKPLKNGFVKSPPYMQQLFFQTYENAWKRGHLAPDPKWQEWMDEQFAEEETDAGSP